MICHTGGSKFWHCKACRCSFSLILYPIVHSEKKNSEKEEKGTLDH